MELLIATTNRGKLVEIEAALKELAIEVVPIADTGRWPKVVEDGRTFEQNALKKARALAEFSGYLTLADDSGLEVDALGGWPGIHSARYSGRHADDRRNNQKLLRALARVPWEQRSARFVCVLALYSPTAKRHWLFRAECEGLITFSPRGANGFGYDPLFFYPPLGRTFGELDRETKGRVSHRGKSLRKLARMLPSLFPQIRQT